MICRIFKILLIISYGQAPQCVSPQMLHLSPRDSFEVSADWPVPSCNQPSATMLVSDHHYYGNFPAGKHSVRRRGRQVVGSTTSIRQWYIAWRPLLGLLSWYPTPGYPTQLSSICNSFWRSGTHRWVPDLQMSCSNLTQLYGEPDGVSNHQPHDCLLKRLFRRISKETSKLRVTGLCAGNSPVIDEFPAQRASNAENVSIWWRHPGSANELQ